MFIIFGVYALGFWYGSKLVAEGEMQGGDLIIVFFSVMIGAMGLGQGAQLMPDVAKARGAATELFSLMAEPIKIDPIVLVESLLLKMSLKVKLNFEE